VLRRREQAAGTEQATIADDELDAVEVA
jgi:hypothetical protein